MGNIIRRNTEIRNAIFYQITQGLISVVADGAGRIVTDIAERKPTDSTSLYGEVNRIDQLWTRYIPIQIHCKPADDYRTQAHGLSATLGMVVRVLGSFT